MVNGKTVFTMLAAEIIAASVRNAASRPFQKPKTGGRNSSTYAAIESGMQPKVLQKLLGHASITTAMNRYVHVTDDSMQKAVAQFAKAQEVQKG